MKPFDKILPGETGILRCTGELCGALNAEPGIGPSKGGKALPVAKLTLRGFGRAMERCARCGVCGCTCTAILRRD